MWGRAVKVARIITTVWVSGVAVVAATQALGWLPRTPNLEGWAWVVSLSIIGVDSIGGLISSGILNRRRKHTQELEKALMGLLIDIAKNSSASFEELGASVYITGRWDRVRRRILGSSRLRRRIRFRPSNFPAESGIRWSQEKGAVGECYRTRKDCHRNWNRVAAKYGGLELTDDQFASIPTGTRDGFTREDFVAICGKYSEMLTVPIWNRRERLLGVLSIDRAFIDDDHPFTAVLDATGTHQVASGTASLVSNILLVNRDDEG